MPKNSLAINITIRKICQLLFSRVYVREMSCKLLSKYLWWNLFLVNFYALSIFFGKILDRFVWIMKINPWETSSSRHSNNIQVVSCLKLQRSIAKSFDEIALKLSQSHVGGKSKSFVSRCFLIRCTLWFCTPDFACPIGCVKTNLSTSTALQFLK